MSNIILPASATQTQPHEKVSEKYQFVSTAKLVESMQEAGLVIRQANEARSKKYQGYQTHVIRMTKPQAKVGDSFPEIIIIGNHHGTKSHTIMMGLYRLVCSNGLVVGSNFGSYSIRHTGNAQQIVEDALDDLHTQLPYVAEMVNKMKERRMSIDEERQFAKEALAIRGLTETQTKKVDTLVSSALVARRSEDSGSSLWEVYNKTQESIIRGTTGLRRITSSVRDVSVNAALWELAEKMAA